MESLTKAFIKTRVADSGLIYERGKRLYAHGSYFLSQGDLTQKEFTFQVDGAYGDYTTRVAFSDRAIVSSCTCPYPGEGCKHVVAAALNARQILMKKGAEETLPRDVDDPFLSEQEIRALALSDREKRAKSEALFLAQGDFLKGDHLVTTQKGKQYRVTLHDPGAAKGHCSCPDYMTNGLNTCKHILFAAQTLKQEKGFKNRLNQETFPFVDIYWDSGAALPAVFPAPPDISAPALKALAADYFDDQGYFRTDDPAGILDLADQVSGNKQVRIRERLIQRIERRIMADELEAQSSDTLPDLALNTRLYPYQAAGVRFGLYKPGVLIGDEMGLGKTLQAISLGLLKKEIFGFSRILVITLASLKEQWKREIEKFTQEAAVIVEGNPDQRKQVYFKDPALFKITNYEAVLRDVLTLSRFNPDLIILDEAQRIKNFSTKTADAVKSVPKKHAVVLTGTPLENKLEDVYSIVQFLDPYLLTPLWQFACDHFLIPRKKKSAVSGYRNLDRLNEKLKPVVIRRRKEEVLQDLPDEIVNNYYVDLTQEQDEIHAGYARSLLPLLNKKFLTPVDVRRIQMLLLKMRQVCDSTYLIDRETHISPKLAELSGIIDEIAVQNKRKMVIFSEWTTMTFLIARTLSDMGIPFVELTGKVPVKKRQALIDEFTDNPDCRVFLSTDAGGTGLNLQAADCVVNFELPWNPARLNQRIGRVNRIGQASRSVNVINLIAKQSIEERIFATIQLKTDLFKGVFDEGPDTVEFSREKKNEMLNRLRQMMGEAPEPEAPEALEPEELPEDTPHYLNPGVLARDETEDREPEPKLAPEQPAPVSEHPRPAREAETQTRDQTRDQTNDQARDQTRDPASDGRTDILSGQAPEKVEAMLNSGLDFMSRLMEMATGQKLTKSDTQDQMIKIDKETGEVTMKFRLPGF